MVEQESTRQKKVSSQIQRDLAEIIRQKGMAFWSGALVSVSGVKISQDLSVAKVYVSIFPTDKSEVVMKTFQDNVRALRGELGARVGKQLRIVPELAFFQGSTLDYVQHIDELLKK